MAQGTRTQRLRHTAALGLRVRDVQEGLGIVNQRFQAFEEAAKGLKVTCRLDRRKYPTGRKVSDEEMKMVNVKRSQFHGNWNYVIRPNSKH